ncbi:DUF3866 family protein [Romboutsia sp. 13368]|uniref:DUF3866 family protein n=1 Tax=Romboutsia sp. 13368 TaxID=2708053 RepID=UPI0025D26242|nr:DUF3866 family protein [Romboutsia sp. 13368]
MISKKLGIVESIVDQNGELDDIRVKINGEIQKAYNYPKITGCINVGDEVVLNTTAVELSLGTGGYHFVISNLNNLESDFTKGGHIMKLRYTPLQIKVDSVEEQESSYHNMIENFSGLDNMPVVVGSLHSMLTPFVASYKRLNQNKRLVYIMTDGAALPIFLSKNVHTLKEKGLIDNTITIGSAFGGEYECINIYTALITAKEVLKADVVFVSMGPGIAGTGTKYGFTGIEQGPILDAVKKLGGMPVSIPRISFADKRDRHQGISHHSITVLKEIVNVDVNLPICEYSADKLDYIKDQVSKNELDTRHNVVYIKNENSKNDLEHFNLKVRSMGRNFEQDKEFFEAASTAAYYITEVYNDSRRENHK